MDPRTRLEIYFCLLSFNAAGKPLVHFEGRKLFQWMPACGNTAVAENTVCDVVRDVSVRLFEAVGFKGMGSVEFKRDPRDGRFKITSRLLEGRICNPISPSPAA